MRDLIDRLRNDEPKFRLNSDAAHEIERLRADLADCRRLLGKYGDTAQELRVACDEKQRCIDSSVAAQREFLAVIDRLRAELAEAKKEITLLKTPNLVWDFDEPEVSSTDSIADGVYQYVDWVGGEEAIGQEVSFLTARKLPNVTVRITSVNDDGEVTFEEIDAAMAGGEK